MTPLTRQDVLAHQALVPWPTAYQVELEFGIPFRDTALSTRVNSFDIHEMLGTKLRALFQRRRGRDLFDLFWALSLPSAAPVDPRDVARSLRLPE